MNKLEYLTSEGDSPVIAFAIIPFVCKESSTLLNYQ